MIKNFYTLSFIMVLLVVGKASAQSYAEYFDGIDNRAYISPQTADITDFSFSMWFKAEASGPLFSSSTDLNGNTGVGDKRIWVDLNGMLNAGVYNGGVHSINSNVNVLDSSCHQVVFMQNSSGCKLYVDGVLTGSNTFISSVTSTQAPFYWVIGHTLMIGDWEPQPSSFFFKGTIDELTIWNKDFTALGVTDTLMTLNYSASDTNLLWYYNFNDPSGAYAISAGKLADTLYFQSGIHSSLLNCLPNLITGKVAGSPFCTGSSFDVPYVSSGVFNPGNVFTIQLSDSGGSFGSPADVGSINSTSDTGRVSVMIPGGTMPGNHYRVRVVSSSPSILGSSDSTDLVISLPVQALLYISTPTTTICSGASTTFTALSNNVTTPSYQWIKNGIDVGTDSIAYTDASLANNDIIDCIMTSNEACVTGLPAVSDSIKVKVNSSAPVSVSILASATNICQGTSVILTAAPSNGGTTPSYQWKINSVNKGNDTTVFKTNSLDNGDVVTCYMTSNSDCVIGPLKVADSIGIIVNAIGIAGNITSDRDTVCEGVASKLTVTGSSGHVQWQSTTSGGNFQDIQGADTTSYTLIAQETTYFRIVAGGGNCTDTSKIYKLIEVSSPVAKYTSMTNGKQVTFNSDSTIGAKIYNWDFGDNTAISHEVNPVHTFAVPPDSFYVCLTVYNGSNCSYTYCNYLSFNADGINPVVNQGLQNIYPNPSSGDVFIMGKDNSDLNEIRVVNVIGQEVKREIIQRSGGNGIKINITDLPMGIYEVILSGNGQSFCGKLLKE